MKNDKLRNDIFCCGSDFFLAATLGRVFTGMKCQPALIILPFVLLYTSQIIILSYFFHSQTSILGFIALPFQGIP